MKMGDLSKMYARWYDFFDGTHKRQGVSEVVGDALSNGINTISVISSGNYVRAILEEVEKREAQDKLSVVNLVNSPHNSPCLELIVGNNKILKDSAEREAFVSTNIPELGIVKDYTDFIPQRYGEVAEEILTVNPSAEVISLAVGSGKLFISLYRKMKELGLKKRLVGVMPRGENGVFNDGNLIEEDNGTLHYLDFNPTSVADKLSCPYTSFKEEGHVLLEVEDEDFLQAYQNASRFGLLSEVSGSAGFVLINSDKFSKTIGKYPEHQILYVSTGRGLKDRRKVRELSPRIQYFFEESIRDLRPRVREQTEGEKRKMVEVMRLIGEEMSPEEEGKWMESRQKTHSYPYSQRNFLELNGYIYRSLVP